MPAKAKQRPLTIADLVVGMVVTAGVTFGLMTAVLTWSSPDPGAGFALHDCQLRNTLLQERLDFRPISTQEPGSG